MSVFERISFDPSIRKDLYARINRDAVPKTLSFLDSNGDPYTVNTKTWQLNIKIDPSFTANVLQLTSGSGLTINPGSIVITPTAAQTQSLRETGYYYELYNVTDKQTWLCGTFFFHKGKFDNFETDDLTITVSNAMGNRVYQVASTATLTPNLSLYDSFEITAQAQALTIANPTGAIGNFEGFVIRVTDNNTGRALTYGNKYRAFGSALPTTTTAGKTLYLICIYNATDDVYDTASREEV